MNIVQLPVVDVMAHLPKRTVRGPVRGFTLIELLVVVAIIAVLVGLLVPGLTKARQVVRKTACRAHLRQVGLGMQMYRDAHRGRFAVARYMPPPFLSSSADPSLPKVLEEHLAGETKVFRCPGDRDHVFALCGCSYYYNTFLAGRTIDEVANRRWGVNPALVPVCWDFDGDTFELQEGQVTVPAFHALRNLLFADGHVGNYE